MTPQERDLITHLLDRLLQAGGQPKDAEAEQLIRQAMAAQPDAPYYLVQTVLIQDMSLSNAQNRIAELERQLAAAKSAVQPPAQATSFLGGLFHRSPDPVTAAPQAAAGPWGRPAQPQYQPQPQYQAASQPSTGPSLGPWGGGQPMMAQAMPMMASGGSGFLRQAATTAAGIAGGALLFEGIQSLFGSHAGGILSNASMQPGISETVINNYYGDQSDRGQAGWDRPNSPDPVPADGSADASDPSIDASVDDGSADFADDQDFGSSDSDYT